jgi:hypothetical protein
MTETNAALLIADNDESSKAKTPAALDDLGDAVDMHELVNEFAIALFVAAAILAASLFLRHAPNSFFFSGSTNDICEIRLARDKPLQFRISKVLP